MSFKLKKQRPVATQAFRVHTNFKTRSQESKHRAIARSLPTQAHLDFFLSKLEEAARPMALELLKPYLLFALPPAQVEATVVGVGGPPPFKPGDFKVGDVVEIEKRGYSQVVEVPEGGVLEGTKFQPITKERAEEILAEQHSFCPVELGDAAAFAEIPSEELYRVIRGVESSVPANETGGSAESTPEATACK